MIINSEKIALLEDQKPNSPALAFESEPENEQDQADFLVVTKFLMQ